MDHLDVTLVGHATEVARLQAVLVAAGACHVEEGDRVHLAWWGAVDPAEIEALVVRHPEVSVALRHTRRDTDDVRELPIVEGRTVVDRRRCVFRDGDGEVSCSWGLCFDEEGTRLDADLLRRAARDVVEVGLAPSTITGGLLDALALARSVGRLSHACEDPYADGAPGPAAVRALQELAAAALAMSCASASSGESEVPTSLEWRMREVVVHAGAEELWATPGNASWPEQLRGVLPRRCARSTLART